jgi:hypothetical protein
MKSVQTDKEKLSALLKKLEEAEGKLAFRLGHFRGVPHESASGELAYTELKVLEDYVESLKKEVEALKLKLGSPGPKV